MRSEELIQAGRLSEAVASLNQEAKDDPQDLRTRTTLFELLCVLGEWQRAERTLAVMAELSVEVAEGVVPYQKLLAAEGKRRGFLQGGPPPLLPAGGEQLAPYLDAVKQIAAGKTTEAAALLDQAELQRPRPSGQRSGAAFADLRDADDRFAAVLEVLLGEEYAWLPLAALRTLQVYPPRHLRDIVFAPAMVDWGPGPQPVFLPVRYPGSEQDERPEVRLARRTTSRQDLAAPVLCLGQRVLLLDDTAVPLLELGALQLKGGRNNGDHA